MTFVADRFDTVNALVSLPCAKEKILLLPNPTCYRKLLITTGTDSKGDGEIYLMLEPMLNLIDLHLDLRPKKCPIVILNAPPRLQKASGDLVHTVNNLPMLFKSGTLKTVDLLMDLDEAEELELDKFESLRELSIETICSNHPSGDSDRESKMAPPFLEKFKIIGDRDEQMSFV